VKSLAKVRLFLQTANHVGLADRARDGVYEKPKKLL
jgi:hypothetical protein